MEIHPLSVALFAIISHSESCLLILYTVYFANQVPLVSFCFYFHYSTRWVKRILLQFMLRGFLSMFLSKIFIVPGLIFNSLIHFELIFMYGVGKCPNFILLHISVQFLCKEATFSPFLPFCQNPWVLEFISEAFYLVPLASIFAFVTIIYCFDDCSFVVQSEIRKLDSSNQFFLLKIALGFWGLCISIKIVKLFILVLLKIHWKFDINCTESVDCFGYYSLFHNIDSPN